MKINSEYALVFAVLLGLLSTETLAHGSHGSHAEINGTMDHNEAHHTHQKLQDSCRAHHQLMHDPELKKGDLDRGHTEHKNNDLHDGMISDPTKSALDSIHNPQFLDSKGSDDVYNDMESEPNKTRSSVHRPQSAFSTYVPTVTIITTETVYAIETPSPAQPTVDGDTSNTPVPGIGSMFNGTHDSPVDSTTSTNSNSELGNIAESIGSRIDPTNTVAALFVAAIIMCYAF
ncbi:hypothetical protein CLU79DRAFT_832289 [Phycomyces nitens]|nr:hypothetical protein CLU79DRAFT_832289 [Phycomyces nitens]